MKVARIEIEGFRRFRDPFVVDLRDALGRTLDLAVFVGPNGCGKTTVLDAVALALQPSYQLPCVRPDIPLGVRAVVSRGLLQARVTLDLEFAEDEVAAAAELISMSAKPWERPRETSLRVTWTFPDDRSPSGVGFTEYEPYSGRSLLAARKLITELLKHKIATARQFERSGGIFTFDQQRSAMKKSIPPNIARLLRPDDPEVGNAGLLTSDTCEILTTLAITSCVPAPSRMAASRTQDPSRFERIQEEFRRLCPSLRLEVERDDADIPQVVFGDGEATFGFYNLSSGQQAILAYVVELVDKRIHRSLVMIDEVELHLEESMQRRLFHALQQLGEDNQLLLTTHSSYLASIIPHDSLIQFGYDTEKKNATEDVAHA